MIGIGVSLALTLACLIALYFVFRLSVRAGSRFGPEPLWLRSASSWRRSHGWYLTEFSDLAVVYGSLGALLGFLLVVYWGVVAMLLGAEIVAAGTVPPLDAEAWTES